MNAPNQCHMNNHIMQFCLEIISLIAQGYNHTQIYQISCHSRSFIFKIYKELDNRILFDSELCERIESMTLQNRRMSTNTIINIINESNEFPHVSFGTMNSIKHNLGFNYLPPYQTLPISDSQ